MSTIPTVPFRFLLVLLPITRWLQSTDALTLSGKAFDTFMLLQKSKLRTNGLVSKPCPVLSRLPHETTTGTDTTRTNTQPTRGVLGFTDDILATTTTTTTTTALFSARSNVDTKSWNVAKQWSDSSVSWFPWIPTHSQIQALKVDELKTVCAERGLRRTGNKAELQERLWEWAQEQCKKTQTVGSSLNLFRAYGVDNNKSNTQTRDVAPNNNNNNKKQYSEEKTLLKADSLAEWARTVDLEPLLQRRQAIKKSQLQGKTVPKATATTSEDPREYLAVLRQVFEKPSSQYSNYQVKQMYTAAKHADQQGQRELYLRILSELKQATPHDARIFRRLARFYHEQGDVSEARAILQEGLRLHPNNAFLWHALGTMAASDEHARECYQKAIKADPSFAFAYHSLGTMDHTQGRIAKAMKTLKQGIEYCPQNHRLHHALGDIYRDAKMLDMAARSYKKALQYSPEVSRGFAYTGLAYVAYEQDNIDHCRHLLQRSIELNQGRYANGWVALAQMEEAEGNVEAARATCLAGLAQYERGLISRSFRQQDWDSSIFLKDAITLKNELLLQNAPKYRSGDRFYNLYRTWARLEERYGSLESVDEAYKRASVAFPNEWRLAIDWAEHYVKLQMDERAKELFSLACSKANGQHGDPYRLYAAFEMSRGNYKAARRILHNGSITLSHGAEESRNGFAELFYTWAVCEWHLGEYDRTETLFDHALRVTPSSDEGSKLRSFILYALARFYWDREEYYLAQHCIGLCLKENLMPGGNGCVWELWSSVATAMGNEDLAQQCQNEASKSHEAQRQLSAGFSRMNIENLVRRDPWCHKLFGTEQEPSFFSSVELPQVMATSEPMRTISA